MELHKYSDKEITEEFKRRRFPKRKEITDYEKIYNITIGYFEAYFTTVLEQKEIQYDTWFQTLLSTYYNHEQAFTFVEKYCVNKFLK